MSFNPYYPPGTGSGYTCSICGAYVPYGTTHSCAGFRAPAEPTTVKWDRTSDVRIADALERIAAALEKLAEDAA